MPRYTVLVYAGTAGWASRLPAWSPELPADLVWAASAEEVRARLGTARRFSALIVADSAPGVDRDLLFDAAGAGAAPVVVVEHASARRRAPWLTLGAARELDAGFALKDLLGALEAVTDTSGSALGEGRHEPTGVIVAVCGPGGTGASTVAVAIAQGLAEDGRRVALADFARHGEQAMLHDIAAVDGVEALVEAHRRSTPNADAVRAFAHPVSARGYDVFVGLRRARAWSLLRPRAVAAAMTSLRSAYDVVVCDIDPDLEGEDDGGSLDVEERNVLARSAAAAAATMVVVASPGLKGTHALVRVLGELWSHGGHPARTVIALNRADGSPGAHVVEAALERLLPARPDEPGPAVVSLPECAVEEAFVTGIPLSSELVVPILEAVARSLERAAPPSDPPGPVRVTPGSIGSWHHFDDA